MKARRRLPVRRPAARDPRPASSSKPGAHFPSVGDPSPVTPSPDALVDGISGDDTPTELRQQFMALHRTLTGEVKLERGAALLGVDPQRLHIYRGFVRGHIRSAVAANFNLTEAWIRHGSAAAWTWLLEGFVDQARPEHWTLDAAAQGFAEWIGGLVAQPLPPHSGAGSFRIDAFAGALATLEWSLYQAHVSPEDLSAATPAPEGSSGFRLNPTLDILELAEGLAALAAALNRDEVPAQAPRLTGGTEQVWVLRRPQTERALFLKPDTGHWFAFKAVYEGLDVAGAAAATGQPLAAVQAAYAEALRAGFILPV